MKFYQKINGGVMCAAREYDVAADTAIEEGQLVKLSGGLVVPADAAETGALLGVAAETHSGDADALDPRADGLKVTVIDDPDAVFRCAAPEVTAAGGTATTLEVTALKVFAADDFNGGYVKLVSKATGSTNTDELGTVRRVTDFALDGETPTKGVLTLTSGGAPYAGDVYAVFPPVGFAKGSLDAARAGLVLTAAAALPLKVVGRDEGLGKISVRIKKHVMAISE